MIYKPSKLEIYGFWGVIKLAINLLQTKLLYPKARIIRFPFEVRGRRYISFGQNLTTGTHCRIEAYPYYKKEKIIFIGKNVEMNDFVHITGVSNVIIGDNVLLASKIFVSDSNHGAYSGKEFDSSPETPPRKRPLEYKPVNIGDNVWIGESVSILGGVKIGKGAIIGANSVVAKDIPPYTIAVGIPAIPIKEYDFEKKKWIKIVKDNI